MGKHIFIQTTQLKDAMAQWLARLEKSDGLRPAKPHLIATSESLGRITAEAVFAKRSSPSYHAAAMDGYAVKYQDTFGATETNPRNLKINDEAIYVNTGAAMPQQLNAVIMIEDINIKDDSIEFNSSVSPWQNVRAVGEDIVETEMILPENHEIRPVDQGALLAGGITQIKVRQKPKVVIIPTGNEIIEADEELKPGKIIEFNSAIMGGMVIQWGGEVERHSIVPDDKEKIKAALMRSTKHADLVVINAGASTGTHDFTHTVIEESGELLLHGLNIKPGKPLMLGWVNNTPVLGIPGYPVSAWLTFKLFGNPVVRGMLGMEPDAPRMMEATLSRQVASALGKDEFLRMKAGQVGGKLIVTPLERGAGQVTSLVKADGLMQIPAASEGIGAGERVQIELLRDMDEIENTIVSIGSHDNALDIISNTLKQVSPRYSLSSAHVGSMGGLIALKRNEAHLAPTHLLDEETGTYNVPFIKRLLPELQIVLVNLVYREQGLMVKKGNPMGLADLNDLKRDDITFINRQRGAGTRLLLDKHLSDLGIDPAGINGYDREEYTHMSVASAVSSGLAHTGLGVLSAARALGLEFIPVARERYDLAIPHEHYNSAMISELLDIIRTNEAFKKSVVSLGGYDVSDMGRVMWDSKEES